MHGDQLQLTHGVPVDMRDSDSDVQSMGNGEVEDKEESVDPSSPGPQMDHNSVEPQTTPGTSSHSTEAQPPGEQTIEGEAYYTASPYPPEPMLATEDIDFNAPGYFESGDISAIVQQNSPRPSEGSDTSDTSWFPELMPNDF